MRSGRTLGRAITTHALFGALLLCFGSRMSAQQETVLYSFGNGSDGAAPYASLIFDSSGNLYGTTFNGGIYADGTVFELSPAGGNWKETVLHSFDNNGRDGAGPAASMIFDASGNLYGTTEYGGPTVTAGAPISFSNGTGTAFELSRSSDGSWKETVLHYFGGKVREPGGHVYYADGVIPFGGLIFDQAGNLYGTTTGGGEPSKLQAGTAFKLTPNADGNWTETSLHSFSSHSSDGAYPYAGLIFDNSGNLYGTTSSGGNYGCHSGGCGIVFKLTPSGGNWNESAVRVFSNNGTSGEFGVYPYSGLIADTAGNLYGTTFSGGSNGCGNQACGVVFQLSASGGETVLHAFQNDGVDGTAPSSGLVFDTSGNLYGTTTAGGAFGGGTVFELSPVGGQWVETVLHSFSNNGADGDFPYGGLVLDSLGNLYGTTTAGGAYGLGAVFEITP